MQDSYPFPDHLELHFDGKRRVDQESGKNREFVAITVKGPGMAKEKFLSDVMLEEGSGRKVAEAVFDT